MSETENKPADGFVRMRAQELNGRSLAWAVCELYGVAAIIVNEQVHVEASPGSWLPFDPEAMLRSLVCGHVASVDVPAELVAY